MTIPVGNLKRCFFSPINNGGRKILTVKDVTDGVPGVCRMLVIKNRLRDFRSKGVGRGHGFFAYRDGWGQGGPSSCLPGFKRAGPRVLLAESIAGT